jgi:8-oxo-dGTP pyrophosphatase MutT (NUDIX family)
MSARERTGLAGPGEEYNPGPPTPPRQAATVILLRGGAEALEVLLVRRTPRARFMGGVWVFPGGAVDDADEDGEDAHRATALRELREEAGIELAGPASLVAFSRWITPAELKVRFDTSFFLAALPQGQEPQVDGQECVDCGWFEPAAALDAHREQKIALVFPTVKHLEQLSAFSSADALLDHACGRVVRAVQPRVLVEQGDVRVLLPGEPGYD